MAVRLLAALVYCLLVLVGCGGGGSSSSETLSNGNIAPIANAGPDQNVATGSTITLDGSGSSDADDDLLTYAWTLGRPSTSSSASLSDKTVANPTFIVDVDGTYVLNLVVNDGEISSEPVTTTITSGPRPNIILFVADDFGWGDSTSYNADSKVATPNIDTLAASGVTFLDAHTSTPMCSPSRYSILTGNYPFRGRYKFGQWNYYGQSQLLPGQKTLGDILSVAGYRNHFVGKLHMGGDFYEKNSNNIAREIELIDFGRPFGNGPLDHGFNTSFLVLNGIQKSPYAFFENDQLVGDPEELIIWTRGYYDKSFIPVDGIGMPSWDSSSVGPTLLQNAINFIKETTTSVNPTQEPFFLYYAAEAAHWPYTPPSSMQGQPVAGASGMTEHTDMIIAIDIAVGGLLDTLEALGIKDNTLFIFTSDNGGIVRELEYGHDATGVWSGEKGTIWEGGHRVPFVWSWPGGEKNGSKFTSNHKNNDLVAVQDTAATISGVLNLPIGADQLLDSISFEETLFLPDYTSPQRNSFLIINHNLGFPFEYALRYENFKLILRESEDIEQIIGLYDLGTDPTESINLSNDPNYNSIKKDLLQRYYEIRNSEKTSD